MPSLPPPPPPAQIHAHGGSSKHHVWQAVRASSAATYYLDDFSCGGDKFQDGAVVANNPAILALQVRCACFVFRGGYGVWGTIWATALLCKKPRAGAMSHQRLPIPHPPSHARTRRRRGCCGPTRRWT